MLPVEGIFFGEEGVYRGSQRLRQEPSQLNHVANSHNFYVISQLASSTL